jgi:hypothetical protein
MRSYRPTKWFDVIILVFKETTPITESGGGDDDGKENFLGFDEYKNPGPVVIKSTEEAFKILKWKKTAGRPSKRWVEIKIAARDYLIEHSID